MSNEIQGMSLPKDAKSGPNCGLTSLAIVAGCSLKEAEEAYQQSLEAIVGRRMQGNWRGRTYMEPLKRAMTKKGVKYATMLGVPQKVLHRFIKENADPNKRYLIRTTGHIQIVRGNMVVDQAGLKPIDNYWGRRKQVKEILVIDD